MRALDATVETVDAEGEPAIPIADSIGCRATRRSIETILRAGELITACDAAAAAAGRADLPQGSRPRVLRLRPGFRRRDRRRRGRDDPLSARFGFGGLAPKPWRVAAAEDLVGAAANARETFDAAATAVLDGARGYGGNDFKIPLTRRTLHAVLAEATRA